MSKCRKIMLFLGPNSIRPAIKGHEYITIFHQNLTFLAKKFSKKWSFIYHEGFYINLQRFACLSTIVMEIFVCLFRKWQIDWNSGENNTILKNFEVKKAFLASPNPIMTQNITSFPPLSHTDPHQAILDHIHPPTLTHTDPHWPTLTHTKPY